MRKIFFYCVIMIVVGLFSAQSIIIEAEGIASMGDDKSRKETISEAKTNAKRNAAENAGTYIKSETTVKDYVTESDLLESYSQAVVKILETISGDWINDKVMGDSYKIIVKVEVIPKTIEASKQKSKKNIIDDPSAPLAVNVWTDKEINKYKKNEKIKIYLKGNKPFFAKVVYKQADGTLVQLLPNPHRKDNYFNGGTVYVLPSGKDTFDMTVSPPFGNEKIIVYASTDELGVGNLKNADSVFLIEDNIKDTGIKTRGITIKKKSKKSKNAASEFYEGEIEISTKE
ncbi:MAG: DUF4384 domain-containing protein [Candidatus Delongbacteria bacterium]|jgi:hypothetical protein|nr:DUF4384 domain-containing protein [Candidatus Delongbacteria bacterium]